MTENNMQSIADSLNNILENNPLLKSNFSAEDMDVYKHMMESWHDVVSASPTMFENWSKTVFAYQQDAFKLWGQYWGIHHQEEKQPVIEPSAGDRRFQDEKWQDNPVFDFLKQSYLLSARMVTEMADGAGLPEDQQHKLNFYTDFAVNALSPSNFMATNPEVIDQAMETKGQSLVDGFKNLLEDMETGSITTTDHSAFKVGENLGTTPGAVVYRNQLIELIQYTPTTAKVSKKPMLVVPPCVNKFYIFDLNERKSMVKYAVDQGHTVFMISWRNASQETADLKWDDYLDLGVITAMKTVLEISKAPKIDLLSWCNGGSMLVCALAVMEDELRKKVSTACFQASMIDFSDPGEVKVFVDEAQMKIFEKKLNKSGVLAGNDLGNAMAMLHANDSIWNFFINNYLMGKIPPPYDVLYWNADTSNLPQQFYTYYVENMYHKNLLKEPGALTMLGKPVDVRNIDVPCYFLSATGDHIVPWKTSYEVTKILPGEVEFILTTGGHVSGTIINHPVKNRRKYWLNGDQNEHADGWHESAELVEGSWWDHYFAWVKKHDHEEKAAPKSLGNKIYPVLCAAPGTYVLEDVPQNL